VLNLAGVRGVCKCAVVRYVAVRVTARQVRATSAINRRARGVGQGIGVVGRWGVGAAGQNCFLRVVLCGVRVPTVALCGVW